MYIDLILEVAVLAGLLLCLGAFLGRVDRSRPSCRACGCDLRALAATLSPDQTSPQGLPACPHCAAPLGRRRSVRWGRVRVQRRVLLVGMVLLLGSMGARLYGVHLARRGLFWTDLASAEPSLQRVEATPSTASMDDWLALGRRVRGGRLSDEDVDRVLSALEANGAPRGIAMLAPGPIQGGGAAQQRQPNANQIGAFLESAIFVADDPSRRRRIWDLLAPLPMPSVSMQAVTESDRPRLLLSIPASHHASFGWPRRTGRDLRPLWGVRAFVSATIDGQPMPLARGDTHGSLDVERDLSSIAQRELVATLDLAPDLLQAGRTHLLEFVVATAGVDTDLAVALPTGAGGPGPPQRWGPTASPTFLRFRLPLTVSADASAPLKVGEVVVVDATGARAHPTAAQPTPTAAEDAP